MKFRFLLTPFAAAALAGCLGNSGNSAASPAEVRPVVGDGIVGITWTPVLGTSYLVFGSNNPDVTTLNWTQPGINGFPIVNSGTSSTPPALLCNAAPGVVPNGVPFYFTVDARTGTAPGGAGSPTITATARPAGGAGTWRVGTPIGLNVNAVGYGTITTCLNNGLPTGIYAAVGPAGVIFSSANGVTWFNRSPTGYSTDLYDVAAVTAAVNVPTSPGLLFVAVGAGGAAVRSTDGITWTSSSSASGAVPTLRSVSVATSTFVAVGDNGHIQTSGDGVSWGTATSKTTANLHSVRCAGTTCVAVGDAGVIDVSPDGGTTWTVFTVGGGASALRAVAYGNFDNNENGAGVLGVNGTVQINTWVVVGNNAAVFESNNVSTTVSSITWNPASVVGAGNFVAISYTTQFVAIDNSGNAFASQAGVPDSWLPAVATGITDPVGVASNGHGYVVVGASGNNTSSF